MSPAAARLLSLGPWSRALAGLGLGGVAALGLAPWGLPWITLLALAGLLSLIALATGPGAAARAGWLAGLGYFAVGLHWLVEPFFVRPEVHGWMAPFALAFMSGGLALFWAGGSWIAARLAAAGPGRALALVPALGAGEYLRSVLFTGFPWNLLGHVWIDHPAAQAARLFGAHGLTLVTLGLGAAGAVALLSRRPGRWAALALAALLGWEGGARLLAPGAAREAAADAPIVRLVQPNAPQDQKWDPAFAPLFFERALGFTAEGAGADLTVWPETSIPYLLDLSGTALEEVADAARGRPVVAGIQRRDGGNWFNALVVIGRAGLPLEIYDKAHLVPFGEYIPLIGLLDRVGLGGIDGLVGGGFSPGPANRVIDLPGIGPALPMICYEGIFAEEIGTYDRRPRLLLLITNDAWFGGNAGPKQHLAQARLRAIEQGLPMVRAANTGISAVIDGRGRIVSRIPLGQAGFADSALPPALRPTPYAGWGDWPVIALLGLALAGLALRRRTGPESD